MSREKILRRKPKLGMCEKIEVLVSVIVGEGLDPPLTPNIQICRFYAANPTALHRIGSSNVTMLREGQDPPLRI
jgi:hypothetical protein